MSRPRYYSPRISRPLITRLYHEAKARGIPMTSLVDHLIEEGLGKAVAPAMHPQTHVAAPAIMETATK